MVTKALVFYSFSMVKFMYFMYIVNVMHLKPPSPKEVKQNCGKTVQTYKFQSLVVTVSHIV